MSFFKVMTLSKRCCASGSWFLTYFQMSSGNFVAWAWLKVKQTKAKIDARLNEGYTLDDFIVVIEKKVFEWKNTDMEKYLRPETLFGSKFESYLNQPVKKKIKTANPFLESLVLEELEEQNGKQSNKTSFG